MTYKEKYSQATKLMEAALKSYHNGKYKEANTQREEAMQLFEQADKDMFINVKDDTLLYGSKRNFGIIYHIFESNMDMLLSTKEGRSVLKEFTNKINGDKVLKEELRLFDCLITGRNVASAEFLVNEAISLIPKFTEKELLAKHNELISILRKANINEYVDIDEEKLGLYEAIEYLMHNKANFSNIEDVVTSKAVIKEHLESVKKASQNAPSITNEPLTEDEQQLVEEFNKAENKEELFNSYKTKTLATINEATNLDTDKERWNSICETVNEMKYDEKSALYYIAKMQDINNVLSQVQSEVD